MAPLRAQSDEGREIASDLWGKNGELWDPDGRLPDFSFAGYREGLVALPHQSAAKNLKSDFGAKGDGVTDDTEAFLNAIRETRGVLFIPAGKYVITKILRIARSDLVLRGSGAGKTILYFPKSLLEIEPLYVTPHSRVVTGQTSGYHGHGGHIWVDGAYGQVQLAAITQPSSRGDKSVVVDEVNHLRVGQYVELSERDDASQSLVKYLYGGDAGEADKLKTVAWEVAKIMAIDGKRVALDRTLRCAIDLKWRPVVSSFNPSVSEVGIEDLSIEYPLTNYRGHFYEQNNAIYFGSITDSWINHVTVLNADEAFLIHGRFCTLSGITVNNQRIAAPKGFQGHNGVLLDDNGGDNLVRDFEMNAVYMHTISVRNTAGNVFSHGRGDDLDFDCAAHCPYANLFTQIDLGKGNVPWNGSGGPGQGKSGASWNTFWNITSAKELNFPPAQFG
ncbi:MAG: glycosyl hydrolase family 28-related protein, partial [Opitutus sp.]